MTTLLLHMNEPTGIAPSDAAGNLDDLFNEAGIDPPASVDTWTGKGREFLQASSQRLTANDLADGDTLLQRDMTIRVLLSLNLIGAVGTQTIITRGLNDGSASERYAYGLQLAEMASLAGHLYVQLFWQDSADVVKEQPGGVFKHLGDGKEFMLTVTRRWESSGKVVCRYYVDAQMIAEIETADGDISGGTTGTMTIGARKAAGAWDFFLNGVIDELEVLDYEVTPEEVRQTWLRLTEHQPAGVAQFSGLVPKGLSWAKNPGNNIGRRVKVAGQAIGLQRAAAEEMRALWLPHKAPDPLCADWEDLCGIAAKPGDSIDKRHTRLEAYLQREDGFALPSIQEALREIMDVASKDQIEILEYDNIVTDDFLTFDLDTKWLKGPTDTWTNPAGVLHINVAGGTDLRWSTVGDACHVRIPLDTGGGRLWVRGKLSGYGANPADTGVGMFLINRVTKHALWFGVLNVAGTLKLGWKAIVNNVAGAFNVLVTPAAAGPYWLRVESTDTPGTYTLSYSTTGPNTGYASSSPATGVLDLQWAGFGAWSEIAAPVADIDADFDDYMSYTPDGDRAFAWYAYRDPAILGAPDMEGAHLTVQRIKPAHTYGGATESKTAVLCNDPRYGLAGRGPCGSW